MEPDRSLSMEDPEIQSLLDDDSGVDLDAIAEAIESVAHTEDGDKWKGGEPVNIEMDINNTEMPLELALEAANLKDESKVYEGESAEYASGQEYSDIEAFEDEYEYNRKEGPKHAELMALQKLDDECTLLQQEGKYNEALECMEKGLVLRQHFFGSNSPQVWQACKTVGEMCNLLAMTFLQQEDFPIVLELLKKAEILTERDPNGRAVTLNNLACYHRRQGNLHAALSSLTHALCIEEKLEDVPNRADTHLNMCAVLSQLGKHQEALEHSQSALILLHEELFSDSDIQSNGLEEKSDRLAVLAIAYHNVGVEYEFLKKLALSMQSYKKGYEMAEKYLGPQHGIVVTLKNSYLSAKQTMAAKKKKGVRDETLKPKRGIRQRLKRGKSSSRVGIQG